MIDRTLADLQGLAKRLMGLEPTTFGMASSGEIADSRCLCGSGAWGIAVDSGNELVMV
jgi:hypothetical protein